MNASDTHAMRLGIGSYTYPWAVGIPGHRPAQPMTAADLLDKAASSVCASCRSATICRWTRCRKRSWTELRQVGPATGNRRSKSAHEASSPDHLRRHLELAAYFGSPILRVVIDTAGHHPSLDEVVDLLGPWRGELERADVCLAIENHDRFSAEQFRDIVTRLDSPHVGICLDTVNSFGAVGGSGDRRRRRWRRGS